MTPLPRQVDQRFRRRERLRQREDFARVFAAKCTASDRQLVVYVAANELDWSRLGRSVGRRVGNAIQRNRVRRWIREAFRTQKGGFPEGLDIVVVAKPQACADAAAVIEGLPGLIKKAARKLDRRKGHA
ncbi:MAG: ribonuclease P protein component [Phycisphaerae bacterium]